MANYYTQFSFIVPVDNPAAAVEQAEAYMEDEDPWGVEVEVDLADGGVWITDSAGEGLAESAALVVGLLLEVPGAPDTLIFEWADTCSKPRLDAFGGGACRVTKDGAEYWHSSRAFTGGQS